MTGLASWCSISTLRFIDWWSEQSYCLSKNSSLWACTRQFLWKATSNKFFPHVEKLTVCLKSFVSKASTTSCSSSLVLVRDGQFVVDVTTNDKGWRGWKGIQYFVKIFRQVTVGTWFRGVIKDTEYQLLAGYISFAWNTAVRQIYSKFFTCECILYSNETAAVFVCIIHSFSVWSIDIVIM